MLSDLFVFHDRPSKPMEQKIGMESKQWKNQPINSETHSYPTAFFKVKKKKTFWLWYVTGLLSSIKGSAWFLFGW